MMNLLICAAMLRGLAQDCLGEVSPEFTQFTARRQTLTGFLVMLRSKPRSSQALHTARA